ncbi:MAG: Cache 3/Cache 2 fusion domain-containing protein [Spirochaetales bacterium]|nr:Cache 3/Cache 2 fusion domain-containing protein [Spirochaetales bacterium]
MKIRTRLVLTFTLLIFLIFAGVTTAISIYSRKNISESLNLQLYNLTQTITSEVEFIVYNTAKTFTQSTGIQLLEFYNLSDKAISKEDSKKLLLEIVKSKKIGKTGYLAIIDNEQKIVYHPTEQTGSRLSVLNEWLNSTVNNEIATTTYQYNGKAKILTKINIPEFNWQILITAYVWEFKQYIDYTELGDLINSIKIGESGYPSIVDENGIILTHPSLKMLGNNITTIKDSNGIQFLKDMVNNSIGKEEYPWLESDGSIKNKFLNYVKIDSTGWYILTTGYVDDFFNSVNIIQTFLIIASILGVIISFIALYFISLGIVNPIGNLSNAIKEISEGDGDLTRRVETKRRDETGVMATFLNTFIHKLNIMMKDIKDAAHHTLVARDDLSAASEETAASLNQIGRSVNSINSQIHFLGSNINITKESVDEITININNLNSEIETQNAMVEESTAAITEMISSIDSVSNITTKKQITINNLVKTAKEGEEVIIDTQRSVNVVKDQLQDINELTNIISSIASRTNLLAMNAAIEAAHAGDAGKGFAVVADEIRKLAESSSISSNKIKETIKRVNLSINETSEHSEKTGQSFASIDREISEVVHALNEIVNSTQELQAGGQELLEAIGSLMNVSGNVKDNSNSIKSSLERVNSAMFNTSDITNKLVDAITEVSLGTEDIISSMDSVTRNISLISEKADNLTANVDKFKIYS